MALDARGFPLVFDCALVVGAGWRASGRVAAKQRLARLKCIA